jgi:hypothetical protein
MPDEPRFSIARRGYERAEVDAWAAEVAARLKELENQRTGLAARLEALGGKDPASLEEEFDSIGQEVTSILQSAREAAEGMRSRAAADASMWRAAAEAEAAEARASATTDAAQVRTEAEAAAEQARSEGWETGAELLRQAEATAEQLRAEAARDALTIRAEAEQEAHRIITAGKREIEELARESRLKAERTVAVAKAESEAMIQNARREAEAAQERTRALEQRRADLTEELEETRAAIAGLEAELTARRESLTLAVAEPEELDEGDVPAAEAAGDETEGPAETVAGEDDEADAEPWSTEDGIRVFVPTPEDSAGVDALEIAAEVEALHRSQQAPSAVDPDDEADDVDHSAEGETDVGLPESAPESKPAAAETDVPVAAPAAVDAGLAVAESDAPVSQPEAEPLDELVPAPEPQVGPVPEREAVSVPEAEEPSEPGPVTEDGVSSQALAPEQVGAEPEARPEPEPPSEPEQPSEVQTPPAAPATSGIDDLFARLRGNGAPVIEPVPDDDTPAEAPEHEPGQDVHPSVAEAPAAPVLRLAPELDALDPFELRDRLLLPVTNKALRSLKHEIVELQNVALEELRTGGDAWRPDGEAMAATAGSVLGDLADQSARAGADAAGEMVGIDPPAQTVALPDDAHLAVGTALADEVTHALERAATSDAGPRQTATAVSRVFRAWRTDEAERWVRHLAVRSYHRELLAVLAAAGIDRVEGVPAAPLCAECPAAVTATWTPGGEPPPGTALPPAHLACACTVAPAVD